MKAKHDKRIMQIMNKEAGQRFFEFIFFSVLMYGKDKVLISLSANFRQNIFSDSFFRIRPKLPGNRLKKIS